MIDEHGLTLPQNTYPLDLYSRRDEVRFKQKVLGEVRVYRARRARAELKRWLRRALTLGLWRN